MTSQAVTQNLFERFTSLAGIKTSAKWDSENKKYEHEYLKMDFNPTYGGYRLDWVSQNTGERFFSLGDRLPAKEMQSFLRGLIAGYSLIK